MVSLLYKHITKRTGGLLSYQHLRLNAALARRPLVISHLPARAGRPGLALLWLCRPEL